MQSFFKYFFKYYRSTLGLSVIASLIAVTSSTTNAYEIPTTPAAWTGTNVTTGTGNTEPATKDTPAGLRMRVSVSGSNTGVLARNNTTLMTQGNILLPTIPSATNGLQLLTDFSNCPNGTTVLTCSGRGSFSIEFLDTANNPIKVRNPILHWSRLGGGKSLGTNSFMVSAVLEMATPNLRFSSASGSSIAVSSGTNNNIRWAFPATTPASIGVCSTTISSAGCGSTPITDVNGGSILTSRLDFNVTGERTNGSLNWNETDPTTGLASATQDGFFLTASFEEDYGDAPASFDTGGAASHIISDLELGSTIDADNIGTANGGATGTPLVAISPNAVAAGTANNGVSGDGTDEDGVTSWAPLTTSATTYSTTVTMSGVSRAAKVCGWIDFNRNNTFDNPTERACADVVIGQTSAVLNWSGLSGLTAGQNYARVRLSYDLTGVQNPKGALNSGEVEDYQIPITASVAVVNLSGKVFEDINYGGGAGRNFTTSGINGRQNARVELYDNAGAFVSSTTTDAAGNYIFSVSPSNTYTVRVVNSSVSSARSGYTNALIPVQTFRTNGLTTNVGTPDPNRVGGESPQITDAGNGSTTLAALTTGTTTAQSITSVSVGAASATGIDFGYNFDTIVNTNDAGQGSLRQFILNSNALLNTNLDQVPNPSPSVGNTAVDPAAGEEASIFMISDGFVHPGLRAGLSNLLTNGVVAISPTTSLPVITDIGTSIDGRTQTANVGNTKTGNTGYSSTVGVPASTSLSGVPNPEVQISNNQTQSQGLNVTGNNFAARGISIYGFGNVGIDNNANILLNGSSNSVIEKSLIGTASGAVLNTIPTTGNGVRHGIAITNSATNITIQDNSIAENGLSGIYLNDASPNVYNNITIQRNEAAFNGVTDPSSGDGFTLANCTSGCTIQNNYIHDNQAYGIQDYQNLGLNITTNTINSNGVGGTETSGIMVWGSIGTQIFQNIVSQNTGDGVYLARHPYVVTQPLAKQVKISQNSFFGNGQLGIDLAGPSANPTVGYRTGQTPYVTANDGITDNTISNNGMDYPVITYSTLIAGNLQVKGFIGNTLTSTNFSGAKLEFFIADNSPANQNGEVILNDGKSKSHGEGKTYLGACIADGNSQFNCSFPTAGTVGLTSATNITATATDGNGNTSEFSAVPSTRASLLLVKRITAVTDGVTNTTTNFSSFVDDPSTSDDNHSGWPSGYLLGAIDGGKVKPGDEVEYTIYFLNGGENRIAQAKVCDRLNADLIFQPQFDTSATNNQGILLAQGIGSQYLTNINDSDRGLLSSSSTMPLNCNITSNSTLNLSNNVLVVDVATSSGLLLGGERGYIKFKVKVRQ
jgi:GEVED domain/Right handed beta helix region